MHAVNPTQLTAALTDCIWRAGHLGYRVDLAADLRVGTDFAPDHPVEGYPLRTFKLGTVLKITLQYLLINLFWCPDSKKKKI